MIGNITALAGAAYVDFSSVITDGIVAQSTVK